MHNLANYVLYFSNRDVGPALRNAGQILGVFCPFLFLLSLSPRLIRPTLASPHTINTYAGGTVVATPSFGPAFYFANEGTYSRDPRFTGVLNPAVLEYISAPPALALASVT